jgi:hypothetical protein
MRLFCLIFILFSQSVFAEYLFTENKFQANKKWKSFSTQADQNLKNLLRTLIRSKTGKLLVKKANKKAKESGQNLLAVIKAGNGSLTDTTLIRKFTVGAPDEITYETKSVVYLNNELNQYDALLDLAHELTHYVYRKNFNPYEMNFTLSQFIKNTVEGIGGEVQAFMMECKVQKELFPRQDSGRYNCMKITDGRTGKLSYKRAVEYFYRVGDYYHSFAETLKKHGIREKFPKVTNSKASFVSSAYGIPYPVAAFEEYLTVINKVCENDKKRIGYFKNAGNRAPASLGKMQRIYKKRCRK